MSIHLKDLVEGHPARLDRGVHPLRKRWPKANGVLVLDLGPSCAFATLTVAGGPFVRAFLPYEGSFGLCLTERRAPYANAHMPIEDFSVPSGEPAEVEEAIKAVILASLTGKTVFAGCLGGWGRTGLFLALLAKVAGQPEPVAYVRANYTPKAVETAEQAQYVADFDVRYLRRWMQLTAWRLAITARFAQLIAR